MSNDTPRTPPDFGRLLGMAPGSFSNPVAINVPQGMSAEEVARRIRAALEGPDPAAAPTNSRRSWRKEFEVAKLILDELRPTTEILAGAAKAKMVKMILDGSAKTLDTEELISLSLSMGCAIFLEVMNELTPPPSVIDAVSTVNGCDRRALTAILFPILAADIVVGLTPELLKSKLRPDYTDYFS